MVETQSIPATLQVYRYDARTDNLRVIVGDAAAPLPPTDLIERAREALQLRSFVCHTVTDYHDVLGDEVCFIPRGERCDIVSIHTNGWRRHHGDHRRSLLDILNDLAAAVARGRLHFLDDAEIATERARGVELLFLDISDSASLAAARYAVEAALQQTRLPSAERKRLVLSVSEATTNMLVHGGGSGCLSLRLLDDRLRVVVSDAGPGLNFFNWIKPRSSDQVSMGYGYKIILENLEQVYLHTNAKGTTLVLDCTFDERLGNHVAHESRQGHRANHLP